MGRYLIPWAFPTHAGSNRPQHAVQEGLIDGGSALNILFVGALTELGLTKDDLIPIDSPFQGIVPSKVSQPLGQITLPVQFGSIDHFCTEYVNFFVADFNTAYHAILG